MTKSFVDEVGAASMRATVWREALQRHNGNISKASDEFGFSKQRGHKLTKQFDLVALALELRAKAGQPATGRPKKDKPPKDKKRSRKEV